MEYGVFISLLIAFLPFSFLTRLIALCDVRLKCDARALSAAAFCRLKRERSLHITTAPAQTASADAGLRLRCSEMWSCTAGAVSER